MSVSADTIRTQIDYSEWASRRLVEAAARLTPEELGRDFHTADRSVLDTLVHVYAADRVWLSRFVGSPRAGFRTDDDRSLAVLENEWPVLHQSWRQWAADLTDQKVMATLDYADLKGRQWSQPLWQLVLHVVNHGTHHRGQVSGFLRAMGHEPPPLDLVFYFRQLG